MKRFIHLVGHLFGMDCAVTYDRDSECWRCKQCSRRERITYRWW